MKYLLILMMALLPSLSFANEAKELAEDPVIEKRMLALAENVRCLVCQNQSLAGSHADLAEDLRREIREQMHRGLSDQEILDYLVSRYGDFVLYDPPMKLSTYALWFGPFILLIGAAAFLVIGLRKRKQQVAQEVVTLSEEDMRRAAALLQENDTPSSNTQTTTKES